MIACINDRAGPPRQLRRIRLIPGWKYGEADREYASGPAAIGGNVWHQGNADAMSRIAREAQSPDSFGTAVAGISPGY